MKRYLVFALLLAGIFLSSSTRNQQQLLNGFIEYRDPEWNFGLMLPETWEVHNTPNLGVGYVFTSPDLQYDLVGNPDQGAYITVSIEKRDELDRENVENELFEDSEVTLFKPSIVDGEEVLEVFGYNEYGYPFYDSLFYAHGHLFRFHYLTHDQDYDIGLVKTIFTSIRITGEPKLRIINEMWPLDFDFSFPPLLLPFEQGYGKIIHDYMHDSHHGGNTCAFDVCEGQGCPESAETDYVLAPTDLVFDYSVDSDGNGSIDYHFFEIDDDGTNKLCLTLGHFELDHNLTTGDSIPKGLALGQITEYSPSIEHIHMGLYVIPSSEPRCASNNYNLRMGVVYIDPFTLDGVNYPIDPYNEGDGDGGYYEGLTVLSHNQGNYDLCISQSPNGLEDFKRPDNSIGDLTCHGGDDTTPPSGYITSPSNGSTVTTQTVTISANATDNQGGSGIYKVEFRAYWPGSTYSIIGSDYTYPYSTTWDMCNSSVPDGQVQLDLKVFDNDGNYYVYSENYNKPTFTKSYSCGGGGGGGNCPSDNRDGVYFYADQNYSGDCHYSLTDIPDLGTTTVGNDRLSSVRIRGDYQVKLYEDSNYGGGHDELNSSDSNLDIRSLGDQYSSAKINEVFYTCPTDGREGVYMYSQAGYTGDCLFSTTDIPNFSDTIIGDNDLDSIRFIGNWDAKLYEDAYYQGRYDYIGSNDSDLSDSSLGDQFSSAKLIQNTPEPTPTLPPNTTVLLSPSIHNGGFETGSMTGWSTTGGSFVIDTMNPHSGSFYVKGTSATEAKFYRYFDLSSYQTAINEGRASSSYYVFVDVSDSEEYKYAVKFQDAAGNTLAQKNTGWSWHDGGYDRREGSMTLPVNTAKVLIEFSMRRSADSFTDCDVDDFYLDIHVEPANAPTPTPIPTATPSPDCLNTYPSRINLYDYAYCSQNAGILPINVTNTLLNLENYSLSDKISSLEIPDGWSMVAYNGENGSGGWKCLTSSMNSLDGLVFSDGSSVNNSISSVIAYEARNCPQLSATNFSFNNNPVIGEEVTASFQVKNISGRTLTFEGILAGVHGPFCEVWDCPNISDFPWAEDITLGYEETYAYSETRSFNVESDQYLIEFLTYDTHGVWNSYQPTQQFSVSRGIEIIQPVILNPAIPFVGQETRASFTIKNYSNKTIAIPHLMVIAKGPNCDSWDCPDGWADYPWVHNVTLTPGDEYTYSETRPFYKAGEGYFADAAFSDSNPWWYSVPNNVRYEFYVVEPFQLFLPAIMK